MASSSSVDRTRTSPFLLRILVRHNSNNNISNDSSDYRRLFSSSSSSSNNNNNEHSIYAWKDMTLREVVLLLRSINASLRSPGNARFAIKHVYNPSSNSDDFSSKDLGFVFARDLVGKEALTPPSSATAAGGTRGTRHHDPSLRTLEQHKFVPGDFLDITYITTGGSANAAAVGGGDGPKGSREGGPPIFAGRVPSSTLNGPGFGTSRAGMTTMLSEADRAWGIAGDQTRGGGPRRSAPGSNGNRFNPLMNTTNARSSSGSGMSIMGAGSRTGSTFTTTARRTSESLGNDDQSRNQSISINGRAARRREEQQQEPGENSTTTQLSERDAQREREHRELEMQEDKEI